MSPGDYFKRFTVAADQTKVQWSLCLPALILHYHTGHYCTVTAISKNSYLKANETPIYKVSASPQGQTVEWRRNFRLQTWISTVSNSQKIIKRQTDRYGKAIKKKKNKTNLTRFVCQHFCCELLVSCHIDILIVLYVLKCYDIMFYL